MNDLIFDSVLIEASLSARKRWLHRLLVSHQGSAGREIERCRIILKRQIGPELGGRAVISASTLRHSPRSGWVARSHNLRVLWSGGSSTSTPGKPKKILPPAAHPVNRPPGRCMLCNAEMKPLEPWICTTKARIFGETAVHFQSLKPSYAFLRKAARCASRLENASRSVL